MGSRLPLSLSSLEGAKDAVRRRLSVDARALAALRVSLALLILGDLTMRARDLTVFYTDAGVLPRATQAEVFAPSAYSLHMLAGSVAAQAFLFFVVAVFALALLVGYRTRVVLAVSLVLLLSLQARNYLVLNAGDRLLRTTIFLCLFLPLGRRWSVDARRTERAGNDDEVFSAATAVFLLHAVLVYTSNFFFKLHADGLWLTGDAVAGVLRMGRYAVPLGDYIADYTSVLVAANWLWLALLGGSAVLVLTTGRLRVAAVVVYAVAHVGMLLMMRLGLFPLVTVAVLLPFLPSDVWDALERRLPSVPSSLTERMDEEERVPTATRHAAALGRLKRVAPAVAVIFLIFMAFWQVAALGYAPVPDSVGSGDEMDLPDHYSWSMFVVDSQPRDRWYVASATVGSDEARMSLFADVEGTDRPPDVSDTYPTALWHRYMNSLRFSGEREKEVFAEYLCRRARKEYGGEVSKVSLDYVEQTVRTNGYGNAEREEMLRSPC